MLYFCHVLQFADSGYLLVVLAVNLPPPALLWRRLVNFWMLPWDVLFWRGRLSFSISNVLSDFALRKFLRMIVMVKQFGSWECIWVISLVLVLSYFFQVSHNIDALLKEREPWASENSTHFLLCMRLLIPLSLKVLSI